MKTEISVLLTPFSSQAYTCWWQGLSYSGCV